MNKYVLDTSVIITNPRIYDHYSDAEFIIPIIVLEELDKIKHQTGDAARNARIAIKYLDEITKDADLVSGIKLDNGSVVFIDGLSYPIPIGEDASNDLKILACAKAHNKKESKDVVTVLSNDVNMKVRARAMDILAESHSSMKTDLSELYTGIQYVFNDELLADLYERKDDIDPAKYGIELLDNEYVAFDNSDNQSALGKLGKDGLIHLLDMKKRQCNWIKPMNIEQACALDAMMDRSIPLVSMVGSAGSGKSLLAISAALDMVIDKKWYDKIVIYKSLVPVGNDIGFAPGPQPLSAKIATPEGWTTMGELKVGDLVMGRDGKPTKVLGIYPKGEKEVFKVTTTDGTSTECCEDHLWHTRTFENCKRGKNGSVKTTRQIMESMKGYRGAINHYIPRNEAVEFSKKELPISPYTLGVLLGDGYIGLSNVSVSNTDSELIDRVGEELKVNNCNLVRGENTISYHISSNLYNNKPAQIVKITDASNHNSYIEYKSIGLAVASNDINRSTLHHRCLKNMTIGGKVYEFVKNTNRWENPIKEILHNLNLTGKRAWEKSIPDIYKYSSAEDRINLLRGLMDTDGTVKKSGEASFTTTSKALAMDVIEVVRSLGGRATLCHRNRIGKQTNIAGRTVTTRRISYEFTISLPSEINPFYISRKSSRWSSSRMLRVGIESIESTGRIEPVQCIMVENPEHLYLTDDFIVTHNTVEEKLSHWFGSIYDAFEFLLSSKVHEEQKKHSRNGKRPIQDLDNQFRPSWRDTLDILQKEGKVSFEALTYIRGRSIDNAVIVMDECQNLSKEEMKTFMTRAGKNSKILLTGDIEQIDNIRLDALNNGLTHIVEQFRGNPISAHITLKECERSILAEVAAKIL